MRSYNIMCKGNNNKINVKYIFLLLILILNEINNCFEFLSYSEIGIIFIST